MAFSIIITTRNRSQDLHRTLSAVLSLTPPADEVMVTTDGCTDDSASMIRREFPSVRLIERTEPGGSVAARDAMMRTASGEIVVSLDDDSYPIQADFVTRASEIMKAHPEAGVVYFAEVWDHDVICPAALRHGGAGYYTPAFANCAAAFRKSIYERSHGFPVFFHHMYEEPDYALQCYSLGSAVWVEPGIKVRHHFSGLNRHVIRRHHWHARNELWTVLLRCPFPWLPLICLFRIARQLQYAARQGVSWLVREPIWWWAAIRGVGTCVRHRAPVRWPTFLGWMRLSRQVTADHRELAATFGWDSRMNPGINPTSPQADEQKGK